jgi:hypothetical protein
MSVMKSSQPVAPRSEVELTNSSPQVIDRLFQQHAIIEAACQNSKGQTTEKAGEGMQWAL